MKQGSNDGGQSAENDAHRAKHDDLAAWARERLTIAGQRAARNLLRFERGDDGYADAHNLVGDLASLLPVVAELATRPLPPAKGDQ